MGQAFIVRRGGGSGAKLKIVSYASKDDLPATAPNGTVAVITTEAIGDAYVQYAAPAEAAQGSLFFSSAGSDLNILQIGGVSFRSTGAFIRTDTGWKPVDTYTFRDGAWLFVPSGKMYDTGNEYESYTGGFTAKAAKVYSGASAAAVVPEVRRGETSLFASASSNDSSVNGSGMIYTANKIDLTPYKTLVFEGTFTSYYPAYPRNLSAVAWSEPGTYIESNRLAYTTVGQKTSTTITVDVESINGSAHIGLGIGLSTIEMTRCYLIPKEASA